MIRVTLFTKPGCGPCALVEEQLRNLAPRYPHALTVRDVESDPALEAELGERVPVVEIQGRRLAAPIREEDLASALAVAEAIAASESARADRAGARSDKLSLWVAHHWLALFNTVVGLYIGLPFLAPALMRVGLERPARWIYAAYSLMCHQFAFRSFFLFGPRATYPRDVLLALTGVDPNNLLASRSFVGNALVGYKVAICERDVAMYGGLLLAGLAFALLRRRLRPLHWMLWLLLGILPIGLDGGTQLVSQLPLGLLPFRESTALLRTVTGGLFGVMSVWFAYPYVQESMDENLQAPEKARPAGDASVP